jgi:hypothetical protein
MPEATALRTQFLQNERQVPAKEAEFAIDAIESLIHRVETCVNRDELQVDRVEPGVNCGEPRIHLTKTPIDQLGVLAKVFVDCFAAHRFLQERYTFLD